MTYCLHIYDKKIKRNLSCNYHIATSPTPKPIADVDLERHFITEALRHVLYPMCVDVESKCYLKHLIDMIFGLSKTADSSLCVLWLILDDSHSTLSLIITFYRSIYDLFFVCLFHT